MFLLNIAIIFVSAKVNNVRWRYNLHQMLTSTNYGKKQGKVPIRQTEGFGGKRELGILLKIELCQKRSKFCMQFCSGVLNNVLHIFACFPFEILCMQKNTFF